MAVVDRLPVQIAAGTNLARASRTMYGVATGLAAACGKRWPNHWPDRCASDSVYRRLSPPTSYCVQFIIACSWVIEGVLGDWSGGESISFQGMRPCELQIG